MCANKSPNAKPNNLLRTFFSHTNSPNIIICFFSIWGDIHIGGERDMAEDEVFALTSSSHFVNASGSGMTGGADSPGNSLTDFLHRFLIKENKKWWKLRVLINVM